MTQTLTLENASPEQIDMAIATLKRGNQPVTEDALREFFARLSQSEADPRPEQNPPKYSRPCATREVIARRKPRREPIRSREELRKIGRSTPAYKTQPHGAPGKRIVAPWFGAVAHRMADGTDLKTALFLEGVTLTGREIHNLYRLKEFKAMYRAERYLYQLERQRKFDPEQREALRKRFVEWYGGKNARPDGPDTCEFVPKSVKIR